MLLLYVHVFGMWKSEQGDGDEDGDRDGDVDGEMCVCASIQVEMCV